MQSIIEVENLSYSYDGRIKALKNISFQIPRGSKTIVLGPNGAGKTTLMLHLNVLIFPKEGKLIYGLFIPFTYEGREIWTMGPLTASLEGIYYALTISLRSNSIMITVIALLSTSEIKNLLQALNYFKLPKKLILLAFFFYRYIFVLKKELTKLLRAQKLGDFRINQLSKLTQAMVI